MQTYAKVPRINAACAIASGREKEGTEREEKERETLRAFPFGIFEGERENNFFEGKEGSAYSYGRTEKGQVNAPLPSQ